MKKIILLLTGLFIFFQTSVILGDNATFYFKHSAGWHWYQDPQKMRQEEINAEQRAMQTGKGVDALLLMKQTRKALNEALDRALLWPTPENVQRYMVLQNSVSNRSDLFSQRWKEVLLNSPQLDYTATHPTSSLGRAVYVHERDEKSDQVMAAFAREYGLFFFYRGDCPYCHRFAPILKDFVGRYGIRIVPISMGGGLLFEFPNSQMDRGQAAKLHVTEWPALFAVDPITQKIVPVSFGLMSEDELEQRIVDIVTHFQGATNA